MNKQWSGVGSFPLKPKKNEEHIEIINNAAGWGILESIATIGVRAYVSYPGYNKYVTRSDKISLIAHQISTTFYCLNVDNFLSEHHNRAKFLPLM